MSMRAMATATVSFGLVSIPVKVFTAHSESHRVAFNWLHKDCGSRLRQQMVCRKHETPVKDDERVKGYEFAKGRYVTFTPEEVKALEQKSTHSIDIEEFVPIGKVDLLYYDKAYYLGPDKGGDRAYALLAAALRDTGRGALARYASHGKQYLVLVRVVEHVLVMQQLHYADELKPLADVPVGKATVKPSEHKLAIKFIEQGVVKSFQPQKYHDEVKERIEKSIAEKLEGKEIATDTSEEAPSQVIDLLEALKASLGDGGGDKKKPAKRVASKRPGAKKGGKPKAG